MELTTTQFTNATYNQATFEQWQAAAVPRRSPAIESFGAIHQMMNDLVPEQRDPVWKMNESELRRSEVNAFVRPHEIIFSGGEK